MLLILSVILPLTHGQLYCRYEGSEITSYARFETKQGATIQEISIDCLLDGDQRTVFPFNISEPLNIEGVYNRTDIFFSVAVVVTCWSPIVLNFTNQGNLVNKNILLDLRIDGSCRVSMQNLAVWAKATYLRSIAFAVNLLSQMDSTQGNKNLAINFKDNPYLQTSINPLMFIAGNDKIFWSNRVGLFLLKRPYQFLQLSFSSVKEPPEFPWKSTLDFFQCMTNLFRPTLSLDYNNIGDLSSHIFRRLLHSFRLQENGLKAVGPSCFRNLQGLETVDLSSNKLVSLPETLFHGLTSLRYIFLARNNLSLVKPKLFEGLTNVKRIYLNDNSLIYIPKGLFSSLNKLEFLHLANNKIRATDENPFSPSSALEQVILQNNHLSVIPTWIFRLTKIKAIDLSSNRITGLQDIYKAIKRTSPFKMDLLYTSFNLENNNITTFGTTTQVKTMIPYFLNLKLTGNPLACDCAMSDNIEMIKRSIYYEDVRTQVSSWQCNWPHELKKKSILVVRENQWMRKEEPENCPVECVCRQRCSDQIIVVNCEGKSLVKVPSSMPEGLIELNLRNNEIKDIPSYPYLTNVTVLKLSNNKIDELQVSTLKKLKHIDTLLIDSNKLTSLPREIETMNFTTLVLDQNWFKCDCKTIWMKHWLLKNNRRIKDFEKVLCVSGHTPGQAMFSLPDDEFVCPSPYRDEKSLLTGTILASILGGLLLLIMIVAILLYKYHGEMKVFMFTHFNWHLFDRIDDSDPTKIYDAFISYSGNDHQWVVETLKQRLESHNPPYKLCFHYRDFRAGAPIVENILKSVDQSKRMLMVLSPSFARSEWCLLEFRAAHRKVIEDRMNYLIIILLDDVNMAELDEEIKLYMHTNTYVSYSDKWFWQKLFYAMPQQPARQSMEARNVESIESVSANHNNSVQTLEEEGLNINTSDTLSLVQK